MATTESEPCPAPELYGKQLVFLGALYQLGEGWHRRGDVVEVAAERFPEIGEMSDQEIGHHLGRLDDQDLVSADKLDGWHVAYELTGDGENVVESVYQYFDRVMDGDPEVVRV